MRVQRLLFITFLALLGKEMTQNSNYSNNCATIKWVSYVIDTCVDSPWGQGVIGCCLRDGLQIVAGVSNTALVMRKAETSPFLPDRPTAHSAARHGYVAGPTGSTPRHEARGFLSRAAGVDFAPAFVGIFVIVRKRHKVGDPRSKDLRYDVDSLLSCIRTRIDMMSTGDAPI